MFNSDEELRIYEELLAQVGISQQLCAPEPVAEEAVSRRPLPNYPTCCTGERNDIVILDGAHVCYQCGNTVDFSVYVYYEPFAKQGEPLGASSGTNIEKKRSYKSVTHFKEHLRRYMGARFTDFGDKDEKDPRKKRCRTVAQITEEIRGTVDVQDPHCYRHMQQVLKEHNYRCMYKEIFVLIYALGGLKPHVPHSIFGKCVTDFMWLQSRFRTLKQQTGTMRKNMPSMYVLLDLLLRRNGHIPYYHLPYLKDEVLQQKVIELFDELDGGHK